VIRIARQPKWILLLLFALALAAVFAWLGKWQVERAVLDSQAASAPTEIAKPLTELAKPGGPIPITAGGHLTSAEGAFDPEGFVELTGRLNQGEAGYWLVGRLLVVGSGADGTSVTGPGPESVSLPVALGWAPTQELFDTALEAAKQDARAAAQGQASSQPLSFSGRLMPTEAPEVPNPTGEPFEVSTLSLASLVNEWPNYSGTAFGAYLIVDSSEYGLDVIDSAPPENSATLNWLNIFYAIEWVVFAGFAVYFWYRLVRDAYEREQEEKLVIAG
jgi:surfeit locus 1 family protein